MGSHHESPFSGRHVLLVEQGFLKPRRGKPVHGVELFRLHLVDQMLERGVEMTLPVERSWKSRIIERLGADRPGLRLIGVPALGGVVATGVLAAIIASWRRYDAAIFGDARRGLIPAMVHVARKRAAPRLLLFAHRPPRGRVLDVVRRLPLDVLGVSEHVAGPFRDAVKGRVDVMYGLPNADRFHPPETPRSDDGPTHFVLLGRLPNISKGVEKALAAFALLTPEVRERCRLHLASYIGPNVIDAPGVTAHEWIPADEVPAFLRSCDAMLALSSNETFSQAIVQGMLTELPVIATGLPVYVEKLDAGGGFIADEPAEIAEHMATIADDPALRARLGAVGRDTALRRYVWDTDRFLREILFRDG